MPPKKSIKANAADLPNAEHPVYAARKSSIADLRTLFAGTRAVQAARERFILKHPKEREDDYKRRITAAEVYNGFRRTVRAMVGLVFQREIVLSEDAGVQKDGETVPDSFAADWENIDGRGSHGDIFAKHAFADAMVTGVGGILVDFPNIVEPKALSAADEQARKLRAYWVYYTREQIISWKFAKVDGRSVMTQLVLKETVEESAGRFGVGYVTYYRVFSRPVLETIDANGIAMTIASDVVTWELWREPPGTNKAPELQSGGVLSGMDEIAFSPLVLGSDRENFDADPPLQDLADVNISHYRVTSDRRYLMHLACVPIPIRIGFVGSVTDPDGEKTTGEMAIGPNLLQDLPMDGDFRWAEISGTAFEPTKAEKDDLERQMGSLGWAFLHSETRAAETAQAKRIDSAAQNATLADCVRSLKDCLENAARLHMKYRKVTDDAQVPGFTVNTEFESIVADATFVTAISDLEAKGQLSLDTLWRLLGKSRVLPDDFDGEKEKKLITARQTQLDVDGKTDPDPDDPPEDE